MSIIVVVDVVVDVAVFMVLDVALVVVFAAIQQHKTFM